MSRRVGGPPLDVLVIGGGQAGLAMGYQLAQRGTALRDRGRRRRDRPCVALALGLAAAVHLRPVRQPAGPALPGRRGHLPRQGRRRRLPAGLRGRVRAAGPAQHDGDIADQNATAATSPRRAARRWRPGRWWSPPDPSRCRSSRRSPAELDPGVHQIHSADYRRPGSAPARTGPGRRRRELRLPDRPGALGDPHAWSSRSASGSPPIPQRPLGRDVWWWATALRLDRVTADSRLGRRLAGRDQVDRAPGRGGSPAATASGSGPGSTSAAGRDGDLRRRRRRRVRRRGVGDRVHHGPLVDRHPGRHRRAGTHPALARRHALARASTCSASPGSTPAAPRCSAGWATTRPSSPSRSHREQDERLTP